MNYNPVIFVLFMSMLLHDFNFSYADFFSSPFAEKVAHEAKVSIQVAVSYMMKNWVGLLLDMFCSL